MLEVAFTLLGATFLTLLVIPVIYSLVDRKLYESDVAVARERRGESVPAIAGGPEIAR